MLHGSCDCAQLRRAVSVSTCFGRLRASRPPARFLREFVDQLDLPGLGFVIPAAVEGRPPYAPSLLLKIWLYGYLNKVRSTRKLEAICNEHLSLVWLPGMIAPDHNSLWRFWRDNKKALREVFKQTVRVAVQTGCVGLALQAVDGTKIEAAASGYSGWNKEYMEKLLAALDEALAETEFKIAQENVDDGPGYRPCEEPYFPPEEPFRTGAIAYFPCEETTTHP
jgi:transposase